LKPVVGIALIALLGTSPESLTCAGVLAPIRDRNFQLRVSANRLTSARP
jgi:hypothetical protein